ncbi:cyclic nucleotide-binding domain protein (macronuclear) [Tetrahymena thermophila SB210]|uniref:Cyclic nucleotide-binding domain protein n=1 Tax=Tetrahymena thermophila (strain SB210) TaxID=312017 RepID=Q23K46_TETTS|nr:cyclic nucleotide-binding domain protein [Tetrahymena thermophila SB210]EAR96997.3 cyclic nucleotide-binding domain protein [Tetrahymena thermophila SB210]|eukprot:XP_001017242.3 cyclic nucleotide-binding domain protein [Tetrahymena thermophila SB210]
MDMSQRRKSIFDPRMQDRAFGLSNLIKEKLDEANLYKNITHSRKFALNFQKSKEAEELLKNMNQKDEVVTKVTREQIIASKVQESQYIKDLLKNKLFYNQRIEVSNVDLTSSEDSDLVIHILKKEFKNKKEIQFLKLAISGLTLFKQNQDILFKENMAMSLFKELKYEFFLEKDPIFHFGEFGYKYYIVLKGSVQLLIPKPEIAKEIEKKREESQNIFNQKFFKSISKNVVSGKQAPRKSIMAGDFNSLLQQNFETRKKSQIIGASSQEIEEDQNQAFDPNLSYEQILDTYYKGWNLIKVFGPGDAFGEIALLTKQRRTGTMICKQDTHIMSLSKEAFDKLLGKYHERVKQEKIGFLRQFQVFDGVPTSKLLSLIHDMKTNVYQINNILYEEGDKVEDIFFIKDGEVELSKLANVQNQKDFIQSSNMKLDEKFQMYNLKHNRQVQREQKIRMRISVITNGECFGDYEIKNDEIYRTQKAVVTRQNTHIYSLHKSLLLDMLKTHKIQDNIIKQNDQNVKFHEQREKEIIVQNIKNQNATNNLVKKHIKKQLKNAMKLPDLSLLTEEEQKILFEQFPYLKNMQRKLKNDNYSLEWISGSNQKLQKKNSFLKSPDIQKDDSIQNDSDQTPSIQKDNQLFNPTLDLNTYQEFTSKFLKKPICMKLNQDTQYKQINLDYIIKQNSKGAISRQTSIKPLLEHISSSPGNEQGLQYLRNSDSDSQDEQTEKDINSKFKIKRSSVFETRKSTQTSQELFFPINKENKNYFRKTSLSKSQHKHQRKESESPQKEETKRFSLKNLLQQQNQKDFSQDGSFSSKNKSSSFYHKMQNSQNYSDENKVNVNTSFQTSNLEQSGEFNKSEFNSSEQIYFHKQHTLKHKDIQVNKPQKAFSQYDEGKLQEETDQFHNLRPQQMINKSFSDQNSSLDNHQGLSKQQSHSPYSYIENQEKNQNFNVEKMHKQQEKSKEIDQPLFWIEDNSLLSREEKRRKVNYVMHQSYKILNQIGLQKNQITLFVGDQQIKKQNQSFKTNSGLKLDPNSQKEKQDQIQSPFKQELHNSYSFNQPDKQIINGQFLAQGQNQDSQNGNSYENKQDEFLNQDQNCSDQKCEIKNYSERKKIGKSQFQDLNSSFQDQDYKDEIISNDSQLKQNCHKSKKQPLRKLLSQGNSPKNSQFTELINTLHDKKNKIRKQKNSQKSTLSTEIIYDKNTSLRNPEFTNNLVFSCDVDQNARIFDQRSQSQDQIKKVDKILENFSRAQKFDKQNPFKSVQMTSRQKREMLFASNYQIPAQIYIQNQFSPKLPSASPKINQNASFLQNTSLSQFNLAAKSSKNQENSSQSQIKKTLNINQISFLSINAATKLPSVQQDLGQSNNQTEQSDKINQSYSIFQKSRKDRKSLQSICGLSYICEKQFTSNKNNQEQTQDNIVQESRSQNNQRQNTQTNTNTTEMSIQYKRNSLSQALSSPTDQQIKGQNFGIQLPGQTAKPVKSINNSAQMLQSIVGFQSPLPSHHKKSYSSFLSQFDQVKEQSETSNYKGWNQGQKQMWNSQLKINLAQVQINQSEISSPKVSSLSNKINNQSIMPAFPKILPSPNLLFKENSRDLKAQQLLQKRNLV